MLATTLGRYEPLLRKVESAERHTHQIDAHFKSLKTQVDAELDRLLTDFQKRLTIGRQSVFQQLDAYQKLYTQNM